MPKECGSLAGGGNAELRAWLLLARHPRVRRVVSQRQARCCGLSRCRCHGILAALALRTLGPVGLLEDITAAERRVRTFVQFSMSALNVSGCRALLACTHLLERRTSHWPPRHAADVACDLTETLVSANYASKVSVTARLLVNVHIRFMMILGLRPTTHPG